MATEKRSAKRFIAPKKNGQISEDNFVHAFVGLSVKRMAYRTQELTTRQVKKVEPSPRKPALFYYCGSCQFSWWCGQYSAASTVFGQKGIFQHGRFEIIFGIQKKCSSAFAKSCARGLPKKSPKTCATAFLGTASDIFWLKQCHACSRQ